MNKTVKSLNGMSFQINESAWTGKTSVLVNGNETVRLDRKSFLYETKEEKYVIEKKGNSLTGMTLDVNGEIIEVIKKLKVWEIIISFIPVFLVVLGGALGGLIGALAIITNVYLMRSTSKIIIKIIEPIAVSVAAYYLYLLIVGMLFPVA